MKTQTIGQRLSVWWENVCWPDDEDMASFSGPHKQLLKPLRLLDCIITEVNLARQRCRRLPALVLASPRLTSPEKLRLFWDVLVSIPRPGPHYSRVIEIVRICRQGSTPADSNAASLLPTRSETKQQKPHQTALGNSVQSYSGAKWPNDPSSATRPTRASACNRDARAGFAAAHG